MSQSPPASIAGPRGALSRLAHGRRRLATAAAALLAAAVAWHVVCGANGITAYRQKRQEQGDLARQIDELRQENGRLQGHVDRLNSDPDAIEQEARERLHYTRPGEVIYTLPAR